jgi:hypothetical protein
VTDVVALVLAVVALVLAVAGLWGYRRSVRRWRHVASIAEQRAGNWRELARRYAQMLEDRGWQRED